MQTPNKVGCPRDWLRGARDCMYVCVHAVGVVRVVAGVSDRSDRDWEGLILFPLGRASFILVPPKLLSGRKFSHRFHEGPLPGQKSWAGEDEVGELGIKMEHGSGS